MYENCNLVFKQGYFNIDRLQLDTVESVYLFVLMSQTIVDSKDPSIQNTASEQAMNVIADNYSAKIQTCLTTVGETLNATLKTRIESKLSLILGLLILQMCLIFVCLLVLVVILHEIFRRVRNALVVCASISQEEIQEIVENCNLYLANSRLLD